MHHQRSSEREFQVERSGQWTKGKSYDTFGPIGPWLVTADEVKDPQNLHLWLELNGKRVQDGSTATMVYGVAHIVAYLSEFFTLMPGDIITTGTPPGVGMGMKPPQYLKPGDKMRIGIDGLGEQNQKVVRESKALKALNKGVERMASSDKQNRPKARLAKGFRDVDANEIRGFKRCCASLKGCMKTTASNPWNSPSSNIPRRWANSCPTRTARTRACFPFRTMTSSG